MSATIRLLDPTPPYATEGKQQRRTLDRLQGKVVGFIDNSKPNFDYLVEDLSELLLSKHGVKSVVKRRKRIATMPAADEVIKELAGQCDLIITGSGD